MKMWVFTSSCDAPAEPAEVELSSGVTEELWSVGCVPKKHLIVVAAITLMRLLRDIIPNPRSWQFSCGLLTC